MDDALKGVVGDLACQLGPGRSACLSWRVEPDITLAELQSRLAGKGVNDSLQTISNPQHALGYSYKNKPTDTAVAPLVRV